MVKACKQKKNNPTKKEKVNTIKQTKAKIGKTKLMLKDGRPKNEQISNIPQDYYDEYICQYRLPRFLQFLETLLRYDPRSKDRSNNKISQDFQFLTTIVKENYLLFDLKFEMLIQSILHKFTEQKVNNLIDQIGKGVAQNQIGGGKKWRGQSGQKIVNTFQ